MRSSNSNMQSTQNLDVDNVLKGLYADEQSPIKSSRLDTTLNMQSFHMTTDRLDAGIQADLGASSSFESRQ